MSRGRSSTLKVLMNGQLVGRLHGDSRGVLTFTYAESWLTTENRRPVSLSMPLAGLQYSGHIVGARGRVSMWGHGVGSQHLTRHEGEG
jgi:hypothetical protein